MFGRSLKTPPPIRFARTPLAVERGLVLPRRSHPSDAGMDLATLFGCKVAPGKFEWVPSGLCIEPPGPVTINDVTYYYDIEIKPRGSVGKKGGYAALQIIDYLYRPPLDDPNGMSFGLRNVSDEEISFEPNTYVVQAIHRLSDVRPWKEVPHEAIPRNTERGGGKDGSTEKKSR